MAFRNPRAYAWILGGLLLLALPFYLDRFWLQAGLFAMAAAIGAIGINLLTGATGQLSMGHAFFLAVGAYGYCVLAGGNEVENGHRLTGLGLPDLAGRDPRRPARGRGGRPVQPHRGPAERGVSRYRHPRPDLHRPACAVQRE